jgi:hypothetical protein
MYCTLFVQHYELVASSEKFLYTMSFVTSWLNRQTTYVKIIKMLLIERSVLFNVSSRPFSRKLMRKITFVSFSCFHISFPSGFVSPDVSSLQGKKTRTKVTSSNQTVSHGILIIIQINSPLALGQDRRACMCVQQEPLQKKEPVQPDLNIWWGRVLASQHW